MCDETNPTIPGQRSLPFLSQGSRHHPPTSLARMLFPIRSWPTSHIHLPGAVRIQKISKPLLFIIFSRKSLDPRVPFLFFPWACSCGYRLVSTLCFFILVWWNRELERLLVARYIHHPSKVRSYADPKKLISFSAVCRQQLLSTYAPSFNNYYSMLAR